MRLENYNVASFEDVGVADEPMAATASPAVEPAPEPEAPSTLLSEMAQQPPVITLTPPPPAPAPSEARLADTPRQPPAAEDADARVKPLANTAPAPAAPSWQGMSLPSAAPSPAGAAPSPGPGIDAATFARIEAMGSRDSSAGGNRGGGFGGFGAGGFGGGNETETWDYSYSGVDGAPDVNISVTYQGDTPVSSMTTTTLSDSGSSVSSMAQQVISLPAVDSIATLSSDLPSLPQLGSGGQAADIDGSAAAQASDGSVSTAPGLSDNSPVPSTVGGPAASAEASSADSSATAAASSTDAPTGESSIYPDRYRFVPGLKGKEPAGGRDGLVLARDLPPLASEFTPTTLDGRAGTGVPLRDRDGQVYYRTFDADGAEVGLVSQPVFVQKLEAVAVTGRRDPNGVFDDQPSQGPALAGMTALPIAARLAPAAGALLEAEIAVGPPPLKTAALASLAAVGAIAAWQAGKGGTQRDMATPEEQREASAPLINVPPPPTPPLPGFTPEPRDPSDSVLTNPVPAQRPPLIETLPIHEQDPQAGILTKDGNADNNRARAGSRQTANPGLADPQSLLGQSVPGIGTWIAPETPRVDKGADYQEHVTGVPSGVELNVGGAVRQTANGTPTATGGANFDGFRPEAGGTVLIDAKDWGGMLLTDQAWWVETVRDEAQRQVDAAASLGSDVRIEWVVPTATQQADIQQTVDRLGLGNTITVVVKPKKEGP